MPAYGEADIAMLLSVCRRELGTAGIDDDIRPEDGEWRSLLAAALDHGLIGPLYKTAPTTGCVSSHILDSFQSAYLAQAARNFQLITALSEILGNFAECAIEVAVIKGPAVALIAYGQITQREFTDLDLLVHPEDLNRAGLVLNTLGYRQVTQSGIDISGEKDVEFLRESDGTFVELHWALNPSNSRFPLEATGIWSRLEILYLLNKPIQTLNLEDTLIALCIHASKHRWTNLKWLFDIAQILTSKVDLLDWDALLQRCRAVGCTRTLFFCIQLAGLLFAVKTPTRIATEISKHTSLMRLVKVVRDSLFQGAQPTESDLMKCRIEIHDRLWDRLLVAALPYPDIPRLLPAAASPITSGPLRLFTRPVRLLYVYGFDWVRTVFVGR